MPATRGVPCFTYYSVSVPAAICVGGRRSLQHVVMDTVSYVLSVVADASAGRLPLPVSSHSLQNYIILYLEQDAGAG